MAKEKKPAKDAVEKHKQADKNDIDKLVDDMQEKFGEGMLMKLGDVKRVDVESIPTGSISLDIATGIGGVPRGRIIEIYGPESSGKTTLTLHIVALNTYSQYQLHIVSVQVFAQG